MKKLKTLAALLLAAALLCSAAFAVETAADTAAGDITRHPDALERMVTCGFLQGDGTSLNLNKPLTRAEAAVLLVRLRGAGEQALHAFPAPFTDVPQWAAQAVNYLYQVGAVKGISAMRYGANDPLTAQQFTVMLLRTLGYQESAGDFRYDDALSFACSLGLYDEEELAHLLKNVYTRDDACFGAYRMLNMTAKGSSLPYALTAAQDITSSYDRTTAQIICGECEVYECLTDVLKKLHAESSYTLRQSAVFSHTGDEYSQTADMSTVFRTDNEAGLSSYSITRTTDNDGQKSSRDVRVFVTDSDIYRREGGDWTQLDAVPASLRLRYHEICDHLFFPTPDLCRSSELSMRRDGKVVITGFYDRSQLMGDITSELLVNFLYDFSIVIDPQTSRIDSVTVSYDDTWGYQTFPIEVSYHLTYTFENYGCTDVMDDMDGLNAITGT